MKHIITSTTIALLLIGCSTKSNFYQLRPHSSTLHNTMIQKDHILTIAEVKVAPYLDKPQIVTRINDTQLKLNEFDRWAGDIDKNIQQVVTKNLSLKLPRYTILAKPLQEPINEKYTLFITIDKFDGDNSGNVILSGHWSLIDAQNQILLKGKKFSYISHINKPQINTIVEAQSQLLESLSKDISKYL